MGAMGATGRPGGAMGATGRPGGAMGAMGATGRPGGAMGAIRNSTIFIQSIILTRIASHDRKRINRPKVHRIAQMN
jgi:hypothetical protein